MLPNQPQFPQTAFYNAGETLFMNETELNLVLY